MRQSGANIGSFEILWDGKTVWVTGPDGGTRARFSNLGVDLHTTIQQQMETGVACSSCSHERSSNRDWENFIQWCAQELKIVIPEKARPTWLPLTATARISHSRQL